MKLDQPLNDLYRSGYDLGFEHGKQAAMDEFDLLLRALRKLQPAGGEPCDEEEHDPSPT